MVAHIQEAPLTPSAVELDVRPENCDIENIGIHTVCMPL